MENVRKRLSMKLKLSKKNVHRYMCELNFKDRSIHSNNLMPIHIHKETLKYVKPIYVGFLILDISKISIYNYYYNVIRKITVKNIISILIQIH